MDVPNIKVLSMGNASSKSSTGLHQISKQRQQSTVLPLVKKEKMGTLPSQHHLEHHMRPIL